jgi:NTP pyrophosphatase (non-canonical NTP hydrolase)
MDNEFLKEELDKMDKNITTLPQLQEYIDDMVNARGFQKESAQDVMLLLCEEIGELAKEVRRSHSNIKNDVNKPSNRSLEGEIADVFSVLLALCRVLNVDIFDAFVEKEKENCTRHWA